MSAPLLVVATDPPKNTNMVDDSQASSHWSSDLKDLIENTEPLGSFVHQHMLTNLPQMTPHVSVDGVGRLGFPLFSLAVKALMDVSNKAPYGQLDQTLFNTDVRDAWQIDATKITLGGGDVWTAYLTETVRDHCSHLGISNDRFDRLGIQANLYKMLIYEEGGHFLKHRDTEKEVNMFGTLIIQLPTSEGFSGGEFTVTHQGVTKALNLSTGSENEFCSVSFYADCEHELHPITSGKRVCLVYSLVAVSAKQTLIPIHDINYNVDSEIKLRQIATTWSTTTQEPAITKIGLPLQHKYSHQSIGVDTLKGQDEFIFATLRNAKNRDGVRLFRVSLLLMERYNHFLPNYHSYAETLKPLAVMVEKDDGSYSKTQLAPESDNFYEDSTCNIREKGDPTVIDDSDWGMFCFTKKGFWFMKGVEVGRTLTDKRSKHERAKDVRQACDRNDDDEEESDDEESVKDKNGFPIPRHQKMFLSPYLIEKYKHKYTGNEGGQKETWYYAAAIIVSLY